MNILSGKHLIMPKKSTTRYIKVTACNLCPFLERNNGKGFTDEFHICKKYGIIINILTKNYIHPKCQLSKNKGFTK